MAGAQEEDPTHEPGRLDVRRDIGPHHGEPLRHQPVTVVCEDVTTWWHALLLLLAAGCWLLAAAGCSCCWLMAGCCVCCVCCLLMLIVVIVLLLLLAAAPSTSVPSIRPSKRSHSSLARMKPVSGTAPACNGALPS